MSPPAPVRLNTHSDPSAKPIAQHDPPPSLPRLLHLRDRDRLVTIRFVAGPPEHQSDGLRSICLVAGHPLGPAGLTLSARASDDAAEATTTIEGPSPLAGGRTVRLAADSASAALARELNSFGHDRLFEEALGVIRSWEGAR